MAHFTLSNTGRVFSHAAVYNPAETVSMITWKLLFDSTDSTSRKRVILMTNFGALVFMLERNTTRMLDSLQAI